MSEIFLGLMLVFSAVNVGVFVAVQLILKRALRPRERDYCYMVFLAQIAVIAFYLFSSESNSLVTFFYMLLMWLGFFCFKGSGKSISRL